KTEQDVLLDLAAHPLVIHDEQIGPGTVSLRTNEQIGAPVSPSWITRRRNTITDCDYFEIRRDTRISRWQASGCLESTGCGQLASPTVEDEPQSVPATAIGSIEGLRTPNKTLSTPIRNYGDISPSVEECFEAGQACPAPTAG